MVFIDLTLHLPGKNHESSSPQNLPNTANNGIQQITKEKTFQIYQCCANNFFKRIFSADNFFVDFLYADNLLYQNGNPPPGRKIMVRP